MSDLAQDDRLDELFHALANRTRRALLRDLRRGPARVTELARPYGVSINAISKHLMVLERSGLVRRARDGAVQSCVLNAGPLAGAEEWIGAYRDFWEDRIDRLAEFVEGGKR
jgi:DNA-binding transcriptional ArsR family regulator